MLACPDVQRQDNVHQALDGSGVNMAPAEDRLGGHEVVRYRCSEVPAVALCVLQKDTDDGPRDHDKEDRLEMGPKRTMSLYRRSLETH
jgi:hypothetical protein